MTDKECLCLQILQACRVELCDLFPYLDSAFASLGWRFSREPGYRVDGNHLECSVPDLLTLYGQNPAAVRRGYLHALLHCLFLHLFTPKAGPLWDLACDMAVERLIEGEGKSRLRMDDPVRRDCFARMGERALPAERIYGMLREGVFPYSVEQLQAAFHFDDHGHWLAAEGTCGQWQRLLSEAAGKKAGQGKRGTAPGSSEEAVLIPDGGKYDYRSFLQRFTVPREEVELDPESFDYIFYHYGMEHYGSMPLIEPLEYKEVRRLEELVIAMDTSGSCSAQVVGYAKKIRIQGRGGTDFGPVFSYVETLREQKELKNLKALLYFTDGDGAYPSQPPDYETAFVLLKESGRRELIPKWARLLLI